MFIVSEMFATRGGSSKTAQQGQGVRERERERGRERE
jgi:hypothetical protein